MISQPKSKELTCDICPHQCVLSDDQVGKCNVIKNKNGKIVNDYSGYCSNIAVEPIEKRPFFHFSPDAKYLSVGFFGCQLLCKFCQNFRVSQQLPDSYKYYSPVELTQLAREKKVDGIAFTYNEPVIYHDYIMEVGHEIKHDVDSINDPLGLVIKTNGFASFRVMRDFCLIVDAINIDLKGDNEDYKNICGGWLDPVLKSIELVVNMGVHLEISYLVLPNKIDDIRYHIYFRNWLADINPKIPLHLLYFYPFHKMIVPSYEVSRLVDLAKLFSEKLEYVYVSNCYKDVVVNLRNTYCRDCGQLLVDRRSGVKVHKLECCETSVLECV